MASERLALPPGWQFTGHCMCDGLYTEKYRKGDYQVNWRKRRYAFRLKHKADFITNWINISELTKTIEELVKP